MIETLRLSQYLAESFLPQDEIKDLVIELLEEAIKKVFIKKMILNCKKVRKIFARTSRTREISFDDNR
jgi:hypothetical protein